MVFHVVSFTIICRNLKFKQHVGEIFKIGNIGNRSKIPHFISNCNTWQGNKKQIPFDIDPPLLLQYTTLLVCILVTAVVGEVG